MKREKVSVRIIGNDNLSREEERVIWAKFIEIFDGKNEKKPPKINRPTQGRELLSNKSK